jgi:hypothetical protein
MGRMFGVWFMGSDCEDVWCVCVLIGRIICREVGRLMEVNGMCWCGSSTVTNVYIVQYHMSRNSVIPLGRWRSIL